MTQIERRSRTATHHRAHPARPRSLVAALALFALLGARQGWAQDEGEDGPRGPGDPGAEGPGDLGTALSPERQKPPVAPGNTQVTIDFVDAPLSDVVKYMAEITGRNFILTEDLKGTVTIISHQPVSVAEAYEAFLSAMEMSGYTTVTVGKATKVVSTGDAAASPLRVYQGGDIPYTDNYVTQIIQLENISVSDVSSVVTNLSGKGAKIVAYAPTNTLIITDSAVNIRRVYKIITQLDVAAPKAKLKIIPLYHATAAEVEKIIEELYGVESSSTSSANKNTPTAPNTSSRRSRRRNTTPEEPAANSASTASVGAEGKYIEKIIADERTNSLLVLANDEAMKAVEDLILQIDKDVDPTSRAQIRVVYLEHAKAEELAQVLSNLSQGGSSSSSKTNTRAGSRNTQTPTRPGGGGPFGAAGGDEGEAGGGTSAVAAFDSGVRITSDENTNSLVIIATPDQFEIINQVIKALDIRRKQVFVEAVILELASDDTTEFGVGYHAGTANESTGAVSIGSVQMNASSLGLSTDLLTGMAFGIFGQSVSVPITGADGTQSTFSVPAFGIALNALQSNSSVNILSTPNILTLDNEEAKIVVGRNIPFPVSTGRDNNGQAIVSYQREDVAITLKVTPQINESDYVTLELFQEVQEIEEDSSGLDVTSAGFITSKRQAETTVLVKDNQTVVIGGLIAETDTEVETKIPILGDLPLIGALFRGQRKQSRKTNMLIFLTPHVIDDPSDLEEVYRIKWAQREEFVRRFYGKSRDQQEAELAALLSYSMNEVDQPSLYRGPTGVETHFQTIGGTTSASTTPGPLPEADRSPPPPPPVEEDDLGDLPDEAP